MCTMTTMDSTLDVRLLALCLGFAVNTIALSAERLPPAPDGGNLTLQIVEQPATPVLCAECPARRGFVTGLKAVVS